MANHLFHGEAVRDRPYKVERVARARDRFRIGQVLPQGRNESDLAEYWAPAVKQAAWSRRRGEGDVLTRMDVERVQGYSMQQLLGMRATASDSERERRSVLIMVRVASLIMLLGWSAASVRLDRIGGCLWDGVLTVSFAVWFELTLCSRCSGRHWTFF